MANVTILTLDKCLRIINIKISDFTPEVAVTIGYFLNDLNQLAG